jgi:hypothetical protein
VAFVALAEMQERVLGVKADVADVQYSFSRLAPKLLINEKEESLVQRDLQAILKESTNAQLTCKMDPAGEYTDARLDLKRVKPEAKEALEAMLGQVQVALQTMALPVPNKKVVAGDTWFAWRDCPLSAGRSYEVGIIEMTYTYLGRRTRDGREEVVLALDGILRGKKGQESRMGGRVSGTALLDPATCQTTEARLDIRVDRDLNFLGAAAKSIGRLEVKLSRVMTVN